MGDVYASAMGTLVMRHKRVPARPLDGSLDGELVVIAKEGGALDGAAGEAALRRALGAVERVQRDDQGRWRVRLPTHEAAEAAAAGAVLAGAIAVFCTHNARPYDDRGCVRARAAPQPQRARRPRRRRRRRRRRRASRDAVRRAAAPPACARSWQLDHL